eukprot:scaffold12297_cov56-Attheya_sp.AAC.2
MTTRMKKISLVHKRTVAFVLLAWSVTFVSLNSMQTRVVFFDLTEYNFGKSSSPQPCSYESLYDSFHSTSTTKKSDDQVTNRDCWSPKDEILQIPVDAIINRDNMGTLGEGSNGGVYRAILKLDGAGNMCSVGLKTEKCEVSTNNNGNGTNNDPMSCVLYGHNNMWKEFMGGFLFIAMRKAGIELPSLIPTWGMVVDNKHPHSMTIVTNISYPFIVGAVMPIREFKTFKKVKNSQELTNLIPKTPLGIAKMMLPAAEALLFMERVGLSTQDMQEKNIGVPTPSSQHQGAFVYDYTFLSFLKGTTCSLHMMNQSNACNFCDKEFLTQEHRRVDGRKKPWETDRIFARECSIFGRMLRHMLKMIAPREEDVQSWNLLFRKEEECRFEDIVANLRNATAGG